MTIDRPIHCGQIGLVTIIDHSNYGNRLQNYAMQRIISDFGFDCTTIVNAPGPTPGTGGRAPPHPAFSLRSSLRALVAWTRAARLARRLLGRAGGRERPEKRLRRARQAGGRAFTRAHIRESEFTLYRDTPAVHLDAMYDYFVVGSDQVWNPNLRKLSEVDFLTFASEAKRIAFSASIGIAELPEEFRDFYRERLAGFEHISVREETAAETIRALTGREVPVTVDPTLMLEPEDWAALARPHPLRPVGDYLLTYFLGPRSDACRELVDRYVARRGLEVVHLNDPDVRRFYAASPGEFLGLVRDARLHLTDSFHGVIFSVIFGTPFVSFARAYRAESMASRLDTLLATLRLEHRKFGADLDLDDAALDRLLEPDFAHVRPIVEQKAAEARAYLARALGQPAALAGRPRTRLPAES